MKRIALALAFLACAHAPLWAQTGTAKNKSVLSSEISTCFNDNTTGAITPATVRSCMQDFLASWQQYASVNAQTGTSYTIAATDYGQLLTLNNATNVAVSLPQAAGSFSAFNVYMTNLGAGTVTITPTLSTINGASNFTLLQNQSIWIVADPAGNYQVWRGYGTGFVNSGTAGQMAYYPGSGPTVSGNPNANMSGGQLTLGQAGSILGSVCFGNASSGTICLQPPSAGALATDLATLPAGVYNVLGDSLTQTETNKTINCANNTCTVRIGSDVTGLGTGVATALGINTNASGGFPTITPTTWTPAISCASGSIAAYTTQVGSYEAIGRHVTARFTITINGLGTCSGALTLTGLPVTVANVANDTGACTLYPLTAFTLDTGYTNTFAIPVVNTTTATMQEIGSGQTLNTLRSGLITGTASMVGFCEYHS